MKIVREHINEKFAIDSDPIDDMEIGLYRKRVFDNTDKAAKFLIEFMPAIIDTDKIPIDIISPTTEFFMPRKYWNPLYQYILDYVLISSDNNRASVAQNLLKVLLIKLQSMGFKNLNK
jgi:hypothetical protein